MYTPKNDILGKYQRLPFLTTAATVIPGLAYYEKFSII